MNIFTYEDYIKCIHTLRLNSVFQLAEDEAEYNYEQKKEENVYKDIVHIILEDTEEVVNLINNYIEIEEKVSKEELEKYESKFASNRYRLRREDILYKLKSRDIYFLIKYQDERDDNILYNMLNYCVDIIYDWNVNVKIKEDMKYPIVVPILIYDNNQQCEIPNDFSQMQIDDYIFDDYKIDFKYNLIEINKLSIDNLVQKEDLFSNIIALKKVKKHKEFEELLSKIIKMTDDKVLEKIKENLEGIVENFYKQFCEEEVKFFENRINEKIKNKGILS